MKKLMTAFAVCALAGAVYAQIESQNIVGYQTVPLTQNGYTFSCATLAPIGMTGGNMILGDIAANENFSPFEDAIQIFDSTGSKILMATYVSQAVLDANEITGVEAGWWDLADVNFENGDLNDTVIQFGSSMTVFTGYAGAGLVYVGELVQSDNPLPLVQNGYTFLGNASPVDLLLGDITANENFSPFEDAIQIFDSTGSKILMATYVSQAVLDANEITGVEAGWWDLADVNFENGDLNDTVIVAGQGMTVFTGYAGAAIIIPNPLP